MENLWPEIITALVSISVSYGVIKTKISAMEKKIERFDADHDLLVEIKTKRFVLVSIFLLIKIIENICPKNK